MSDFEGEVLNDLGRYRETEDAVAKTAFMHHLAELLLMGSPMIEALVADAADYRSIADNLVGNGADDPVIPGPPRAMRISLRLKPNSITVER